MSWISKNEKNVLTSVIPAMLAKTVKTSELQAEAMRLFTELKQPQFNGNMGRERGHVCFWLLMKRIIADCKVLICVLCMCSQQTDTCLLWTFGCIHWIYWDDVKVLLQFPDHIGPHSRTFA